MEKYIIIFKRYDAVKGRYLGTYITEPESKTKTKKTLKECAGFHSGMVENWYVEKVYKVSEDATEEMMKVVKK